MFIAVFFTIAKTWEQPKYPLVDKWMKKLGQKNTHTHTHTHTRILPFAATRMKLEGITLGE